MTDPCFLKPFVCIYLGKVQRQSVHACVESAVYICERFNVHPCSWGQFKMGVMCVVKSILLSQDSTSSAHSSYQVFV